MLLTLLIKTSHMALPEFKRVDNRILLHGGALDIWERLYPLEV